MSLNELLKQIENLPEERRKQVEEYVHQLAEFNANSKKGEWEFKWAGGLAHLKDKFTSVQLQKLAWGDKLKEI